MTRSSVLFGGLATLLALAALSPALAASEPTSQQFVTNAVESNLAEAEVEVSQLALSKTQNPQVRTFAQQMIDDHTKANSELQALAKQKSLKVPDAPDMMHRASLKMLQAKSGTGFDESYISQMNKDHDKAMALFQEAAASGKVDSDLKALASKTLPTLEKHHQLVSQLAAGESKSTSR
jgi:putative membrane protein